MAAHRSRRSRARTPEEMRQRAAGVPAISYPADLPITLRRDDITQAIIDHQVVVIAGETGSGKTTQIPKIALAAGRGIAGQIGHTQPRRIAARTVAERIAEELDVVLGEEVGYAVRFTDQVKRTSYLKVMTDGILLAEIQRDPMLRNYDTLIIDEAHERSLNIDFILGHLKNLLPKRRDLKLIITSATIDPEAFSQHFDAAPIISVSGRTYPVEIRYRPLVDPDAPQGEDRDLVDGVRDACRELSREAPGDILVFLSGEREIRDVADALREDDPTVDVLPLFARLSSADQHKVFARHTGRRIVLATNVAETSLTVPGIKYVVDAGTARISRYSYATKVQRLPIEAVSQASANQRSGRCGRTSDGIAIRLYTEHDFDSRPEFTDPEITRTNLASVILQLVSSRLGDVETFPFIDPPDRRNITDGVTLLRELDAITVSEDGVRRLTDTGRKIAALPIDPRLGRMIVESHRRDCAHAVMVLAAALSIQDPRERPVGSEAAADQQHARFVDKSSDFLGLLNLWRYLRDQQKAMSSNQFRRLCRREHINYVRVREWQDLVAQLRQISGPLGIHTSASGFDDDAVHKSVLSGLLSHIGLREPAPSRDYLGPRGTHFAIFPGSALFKKKPPFVVAAELVDTSRLWGRTVATIDPAWVEEVGAHLVKRNYSEPHWERRRASVVATEKLTLLGVPIIADRRVNYGRIDPELSRELFIRQALVEEDWDTRHHFVARNRTTRDDLAQLEDKARRNDILVDDDVLFAFFNQRVPLDVVSGAHFDRWWKKQRHLTPDLLDYTAEDLVRDDALAPEAEHYPDVWRAGDRPLELTYRFDPSAGTPTASSDAVDGVSVDIPLVSLQEADPREFEWLVPGRLEELLVALIKSLPKQIRRNLVPAPDRARAVLPRLDRSRGDLPTQLAEELRRDTGAAVHADDFDFGKLPDHLRMHFRVINETGEVVAVGRDLGALQEELAPRQRAEVATLATAAERHGITDWDLDALEPSVTLATAHGPVTGYPTLRWDGTSASLVIALTLAERTADLRLAVAHLVGRQLASVARQVMGALSPRQKMALTQAPHPSPTALYDDCVLAHCLAVVDSVGTPLDRGGFERVLAAAKSGQVEQVLRAMEGVAAVMDRSVEVDGLLAERPHDVFAVAVADINAQRHWLLSSDFVSRHGIAHLGAIERYVRAIGVRLERLPAHRDTDRVGMKEVHDVSNEYRDLVRALPAGAPVPESLQAIRWMIEELRVGLFAPTLRTAYPVSVARIFKAIDRLD